MLVTGLLFSFPDSDLPVLAPWTQLNAYQHHKKYIKNPLKFALPKDLPESRPGEH